ncbi:MAG: transketolase [Spirochaetota bacterium]|nr:MAG: transketolase [Spirochaetota bacterium]
MSELKDPRKTFGEALVEVGELYENVLAISTDSSAGSGMTPFKEKFPERHLEFGIMEQGAIGFASGLATTGKIPFVVAIAPFVTSRPFEMFRNDLGYMKQNVKVVGRCAGISYSDLGATHQSLEDIAILRTIPGVTLFNPGDPAEIKNVVHAACEINGPVYIKIGKNKMPVLHQAGYPFEAGKGVVMRDGKDVTIIGTGTVLSKAHLATQILEKDEIDVRLIDIHTLKPIDVDIILKAASETNYIVTVEEHYLAGGLGSEVAELLAREGVCAKIKMIGIDDQYVKSGPYEELLSLYGLGAEQIAQTVKKLLL